MNAETERDRKLARLPPEMLSKFVAKKKQFEMVIAMQTAFICSYFDAALIPYNLLEPQFQIVERTEHWGFSPISRRWPWYTKIDLEHKYAY